jgi:YVTN family beta-propeller protein
MRLLPILLAAALGAVDHAQAASVIATVMVQNGPMGVGVNPVTDKVYVANNGSNSVSVISAATNTVVQTINLGAGNGPKGVAVNKLTNRIYVSNSTSGTVSVIDGSSDSLLTTIASVGSSLEDIAVNPLTNKIYVAQFLAAGVVTVINGATNTILTTVPVGSFSNGVAVNQNTNRVYVSNLAAGTLSVVNGATDTVISSPAAGTNPNALAVDLALNKIYVSDVSAANAVRVIDGYTETIESTITVGTGPEGVGFSSSRNRLYVANGGGNVSVVSAGVGTVGQTVAVAGALRGLAVHDDLGRAYVANNTGNSVSVIADVVNYRSIGAAGPYSFGQVNATQNSRVVTGDGLQTFRASNRGRGDRIRIGVVDYTIYRVDSDTQITLTVPFAQVSGPYNYTIFRQYTTLAAWVDCINGNPCTAFTVGGSSLVTDNRSEVGIAYKDGAGIFDGVIISGATTDSVRDITLTVAPGNRHNGVGTPTPNPGTGVVIENDTVQEAAVEIQTEWVTVEWLEVRDGSETADGIHYTEPNKLVARNNLVHNVNNDGIRISHGGASADIIGNIVYEALRGIRVNQVPSGQVRIMNNTVFSCNGTGQASGISAGSGSYPTVTLRNNLAHSNATGDIDVPGLNGASSHNYVSQNILNTTHSPGGGGVSNVPPTGGSGVNFFNPTAGMENLHLQGTSVAINKGPDLNGLFTNDIDGSRRPKGALTWDIGADETGTTTEVELVSFEATGLDGAVELAWETASEINNLGFHLYRATSQDGPYERITGSSIPGLGSSPVGARYRYLDRTVANGVAYFYLLEDYEVGGKTERHGPVSATPLAGATPAPPPGDGPEPDQGEESPARITYGDPAAVSFRILERTARHMVVELETGGFYAQPQPDGSVRLSVPGFVEESQPGSPALPIKRAWLETPAGLGVRLASVQAQQVEAFSSLRPLAAEAPVIVSSRSGALRAGRRRQAEGPAFRSLHLVPEQAARILSVGFQGETKKALLELAPLRFDPSSQRLLLAKRLVVRLVFAGREKNEHARGGSRGRRHAERLSHRSRGVLARLATRERGLYAVRFEELFPSRSFPLETSRLRLSRQGGAVAFHVGPDSERFARGSWLYFLSEGASQTPYANEAVYELELADESGITMPVASASPAGSSQSVYLHLLEREENRFFATQLATANLWVWDSMLVGVTKSFPFEVSALAPSSEPVTLELILQGAATTQDAVEHHARVSINGQVVAEPSWSSTTPERLSLQFSPALLHDGTNQLAVQNANSFFSTVMLDRFSVSYARLASAQAGSLEGVWPHSGAAEVTGLGLTPILLELTQATPTWLSGAQCSPASCRFRAEAGARYLALAPEAVLRPSVRPALPSRLRSSQNRYDYLVVGPKALLAAAEPLLELRRSQGLEALAVSTEDVFAEFGFGEPSPQALRDFLSYAHHHWSSPSPRYVLLLGDGSHDYRDYLKTGAGNPVLPLLVKTTYTWTASDPAYASVNGEDALPDIAIGRLPASTPEEATAMVDKILAHESAGWTLDGAAVLVSDNPDRAGDFDADAQDIASSLLAGNQPTLISLAQLGTEATRSAILDAFDQGPALVSYLGHGSFSLWAHESIFSSSQIPSLAPQARQPLVLTMNCLNGYFQYPQGDSLAEELVKAQDKGAVAAFSPTGLSLNDPAHLFHRALLQELLHSNHHRIGDAILAAQAAYADTGASPELLAIYHLFGDPALRIQ